MSENRKVLVFRAEGDTCAYCALNDICRSQLDAAGAGFPCSSEEHEDGREGIWEEEDETAG